jgi:hypothetical protein
MIDYVVVVGWWCCSSRSSIGRNMSLIPGINDYLPLFLGGVVLLVVCNAFERLLRMFRIDIQSSPRAGNVDDEEKIREGRSMVTKCECLTQPTHCCVGGTADRAILRRLRMTVMTVCVCVCLCSLFPPFLPNPHILPVSRLFSAFVS